MRMQCDDCEMVFVSLMPEANALAAYNSEYFLNAHDGIPIDAVSIAFHSAINRLRVAHVERSVHPGSALAGTRGYPATI